MKNIKPAYVTFEQAKLLKEKGFSAIVKSYSTISIEFTPNEFIYYGGEFDYNQFSNPVHNNNGTVSRPEQWQVIEWLRVNYNIWVYVKPRTASWVFGAQDIENWNKHNLINIDFYGSNEYLISKGIPTIMMSPQEAYSAAFDYVLNNLI